jgi:hypothetical protein
MKSVAKSPLGSTSTPFSIDKLEFKLPLRIESAAVAGRTWQMPAGMRGLCGGNVIRVSFFNRISFGRDVYYTNGRKFICQYLGTEYPRRKPGSNFLAFDEIDQLRSKLGATFDEEELVTFTIDRILWHISTGVRCVTKDLRDLRWVPLGPIGTIEICKDYHLPDDRNQLVKLMRKVVSRIEGAPTQITEEAQTATEEFHYKWPVRTASVVLKNRGIIRELKIYPKPNGGIRIELQVRKYKFKPALPGTDALQELRRQLVIVTGAMLEYLRGVESALQEEAPRLNDREYSEFKEAAGMYLDDVTSDSSKKCLKALWGPDEVYTRANSNIPISGPEQRRLADPEVGICHLQRGKPGFGNSIRLRKDWPGQGVKKRLQNGQKTIRRQNAQLRRDAPQKTSPEIKIGFSRREFLKAALGYDFLRRFQKPRS